MPLDVKLAQTKGSVRLVSNGQSALLRDPEVVDFAAPRARGPPPPPPKRMPSWRRGAPSVASRQSEMSFGILEYYIRDYAPPATPIVDQAIKRFDFGLEGESACTPDANSGAEEEMQLVPLSPRPYEEEKSEQRCKATYSLFPAVKEVTPSANRLARVITDSPDSCPSQESKRVDRPQLLSGARLTNTPSATRQRADTISMSSPPTASSTPTTAIPSPSYHPRNPSLSSNATSRLPHTSISSSGSSSNSRRIPLRILSSGSTATMNTTSRSSTSTSPGLSTQKPLLSRWSEDTALASPTTAAAVLGCRTSFGSLIGPGRESADVYPACFFEDDDEVPLRRKRGRGKGWRWWLCCGGKV